MLNTETLSLPQDTPGAHLDPISWHKGEGVGIQADQIIAFQAKPPASSPPVSPRAHSACVCWCVLATEAPHTRMAARNTIGTSEEVNVLTEMAMHSWEFLGTPGGS